MQDAAKVGFFHDGLDSVGLTAVTSSAAVYKSWDQGVTWTMVTSAISSSQLSSIIGTIECVAASPQLGQIFAVGGTTTNSGTFKVATSKDGINWTNAGNCSSSPAGYVAQVFTTSGGVTVIANGGSTSTAQGPILYWGLGDGTNFTRQTSTSAPTASSTGFQYFGANTFGSVAFGTLIPWTGVASNTNQEKYTYATDPGTTPNAVLPSGKYSGSAVGCNENNNTYWLFKDDNTLYTGSSATTVLTSSATTVTNGKYCTISSYVQPSTLANTFGGFSVAGLGGLATNTFLTSTDGSTWTTRTAGTSLSNAGYSGVWARLGALMWRNCRSGQTTNEAFWTTDRCVTLTARNMPATAEWRGVVWLP
jgi:hypothetical protein